jgi:hypothetical protein
VAGVTPVAYLETESLYAGEGFATGHMTGIWKTVRE